jgi:hypothetical protein
LDVVCQNYQLDEKDERNLIMFLFDNEGTNSAPQLYSESLYVYLNRIKSDKANVVKGKLEEWFADYPDNEKTDLWRRFRSNANDQHISAFFELYCFALLRDQGYDVEIHKQADITQSTTPDFCAKKNGEIEFFLEATVSYESEGERAIQNEINRMYDYLNEKLSSYFIVGLRIEPAEGSPRISRVKKKFMSFTLELDSQKEYELEILDSEWKFHFDLYPVGSPQKGLGITWGNSGGKALEDVDSVLSSLEIKAHKYGQLSHPYIIAINRFTPFMFFDERDINQVLVGKEQIHFTRGENGTEYHPITMPNGLWFDRNGLRNKQVSGVLFGLGLCPQNLLNSDVLLYKHLQANKPILAHQWNGITRTFDVSENAVNVVELGGIPAKEILNL